MSSHTQRQERRHIRSPRGAAFLISLATAALLIPPLLAQSGLGNDSGPAGRIRYYSTAKPPRNYVGPTPVLLALNDTGTGASRSENVPKVPAATPPPAKPAAASTASTPPAMQPQVASNAASVDRPQGPPLASRSIATTPPAPAASPEPVDDIALAKKAIADCQEKFKQVEDYVCTFYKRERIGGRLNSTHIMTMKARTTPHSLYFKFHQPNRGREAIYSAGRNGGKVLAHDVGIGKVLAGTLRLDPRGSMAMEDNRHPITEAGIGMLIETVAKHWAIELTPEESQMVINSNMQIDGRPCTMIESGHARKLPGFMFHKVRVYIDHALGLPIRFEAYDWPKHPGAAPDLVEEYTYRNLKTNVGLRDIDFDPANRQYSYGRF